MIVQNLKQYFGSFNLSLGLISMLMLFCIVAKSQNPINDSISESVFFDLRKQNEQDSSSKFFDSDNAPSPDMIGQRKYVVSAFELGTALPTIYRKEEKDIVVESPENQ